MRYTLTLVLWALGILSLTVQAQEKDYLDDMMRFWEQSEGVKPKSSKTDTLIIDGYIDAYYQYSTDSLNLNQNSEKYAVIGPKAQQASVNLFRLAAEYNTPYLRLKLAIFGGDAPNVGWDADLPIVQEARIGFKIVDRLWLDVGMMPKHFGPEHYLPRQNMLSSWALPTYFDPIYIKGANLSYYFPKCTLSLLLADSYNAINQYDPSPNIAPGLQVQYRPSPNWVFSYSNLADNRAPVKADTNQWRIANNAYVKFADRRFQAHLGVGYTLQQNAPTLANRRKLETAHAFGGILGLQFYWMDRLSTSARFEFFSDENAVLAEPYLKKNRKLAGMNALGGTLGIQFQPYYRSYLRLEGRYLFNDDQFVFKDSNGNNLNSRISVLLTAGIWFRSYNLVR